jgi:hypothetical protein
MSLMARKIGGGSYSGVRVRGYWEHCRQRDLKEIERGDARGLGQTL